MTEGVELTSRYMASQEKRFDRNIFDSLLYADEGIKQTASSLSRQTGA